MAKYNVNHSKIEKFRESLTLKKPPALVSSNKLDQANLKVRAAQLKFKVVLIANLVLLTLLAFTVFKLYRSF